jgi:hypothetical protein
MTMVLPDERELSLLRDGAELHAGVAAMVLTDRRNTLAHLPPNQAGLRVAGVEARSG